MFEVGKDVFSVIYGWGKVTSRLDISSLFRVDFINGGTLCYRDDGRMDECYLFPDLFESPEAAIEYFRHNAPPKPRKKVKKTVEGWVRSYNDGSSDFIFSTTRDKFKFLAPATLIYEIEE